MAAALLLVSSSTVSAEDGGPFDASNFSATLTFTTDYTFRGVTFSGTGDADGEPALQGSFDWGYGPWFAGAWASSQAPLDGALDPNFVAPGGDDVASGTLEIDYYFGWSDTVGGIDLTVFPLFYTYPGQDQLDDFTFELWTAVGYGFANAPGAPYLNFEFNWSPEFFDGGDDAFYYRLSAAFTLANDFGIDFGYGYQDVGGDGNGDVSVGGTGDGSRFFSDDYGHWDIGVTKSFLGFDFDLRYHDADDDADFTLADDGFDFKIAHDSEVVFSVSRSF